MEAYFQILNLPLRIESNSDQFLKDIGVILHYFKVAGPNIDMDQGTGFRVTIHQTSTISCGNHIIYRSYNYQYILEYLEYKISSLLIDRLRNYYLVHAGVVGRNGEAMLLPGRSGGGKSTLIAGLLKNSFRYLTDEIGIIDPDSLKVYPFPKPLNMKVGSLSLFENFEPEMKLLNKNGAKIRDKIHHVCVNPGSVHAIATPLPVGDIVFVRYDPEATSRLRPISRANAMFEMAKCSFNHYRFKEKGIDILDALVRDSRSYQLQFSQVHEAVSLLESL